MSKAFNSIKNKIAQYVQLKVDQLLLEVVDRIVNVLGYFVFSFILVFISLLGLIFLALGLGEWFSLLFDSRVLGMLATGGVLLLLVLFLALVGKSLVRMFAGRMAAILLKKRSKKRKRKDDEDGF